MKVSVIGASGLVGGNCLRYFLLNNIPTIGTHFKNPTEHTVPFDTLQLSNTSNYEIEKYNPDVIIHCGALTHVDYCEENVQESYQQTVVSTQNLIELAQKIHSKFVYISTDYVFDGNQGSYKEQDTPNPLNVYGKHKLEAENSVKNSGLEYIIMRVAKVFGEEVQQKNFIARIVNQIETTNSLTWKAFTDQYTTIINAWDIAKAIYLLLVSNETGVYHLSNGEYYSIYELTTQICQYFPTAKTQITAITKEDLIQVAQRPSKGGLSNQKFLSKFPEFPFISLENYLEAHIEKSSK